MNAVAAMAAVLAALDASGGGSDVTGLWKTPVDGGSEVRIETCGAAICGHAVSSPRLRAHPDQKDARNREPALRGRPIRGLLILKVRRLAANRWGDGWVYNPEDGGTYRGSIVLGGDGRLRLRGCIVEPLCKTQIWTRVR